MLRTGRRRGSVRAPAATAASAAASTGRGGTDAFHPQQGGRFVHAPLEIARAVGRGRSLLIVRAGNRIGDRSPAASSASAEREARHMMHDLAGAVPNIHFGGELGGGIEIGERLVKAGDQ